MDEDDTIKPKDAIEIIAELYKSYVDIRANTDKIEEIMRSDDFIPDDLDEMLTKIGSRLFTAHQQAHALYIDDMQSMYNARSKADRLAQDPKSELQAREIATDFLQSTSLATRQSFREAHEIEIEVLEFEQACTSLPKWMRHVSEEILAELYTLYPLHQKRDSGLYTSNKTGYGTGVIIPVSNAE